MIAVPDHWHEIVATEAARRKKDIYSEKPLAHTIAEQQAIVRAVEENNVIWQMGSWQRSSPIFHKAAEIVRNGLIGTVTRVEVGLPGENSNYDHIREETAAKLAAAGLKRELEQVVPGTRAWDLLVSAPPPELDYETWVGPAKMEPYMKTRSHKCWRLNYNTGGGNFLTGSAITAISHIGVWISTTPDRLRWRAVVICLQQKLSGTPCNITDSS